MAVLKREQTNQARFLGFFFFSYLHKKDSYRNRTQYSGNFHLKFPIFWDIVSYIFYSYFQIFHKIFAHSFLFLYNVIYLLLKTISRIEIQGFEIQSTLQACWHINSLRVLLWLRIVISSFQIKAFNM